MQSKNQLMTMFVTSFLGRWAFNIMIRKKKRGGRGLSKVAIVFITDIQS